MTVARIESGRDYVIEGEGLVWIEKVNANVKPLFGKVRMYLIVYYRY